MVLTSKWDVMLSVEITIPNGLSHLIGSRVEDIIVYYHFVRKRTIYRHSIAVNLPQLLERSR